MSVDEDYYKPIRTNSDFNGYIEYESKGYKVRNKKQNWIKKYKYCLLDNKIILKSQQDLKEKLIMYTLKHSIKVR